MINNNKKMLSIGFIGGAVNSAVGYAHFSASRLDNLWSLDAGCFSKENKKNYESGKLYGVSKDRVYSHWNEMLEKEKTKLDAIVILTPTPSHYEIVKTCIEKGYPVICEKSLGINLLEVNDIHNTKVSLNSFLCITYNYSGYPILRLLKNIIKEGDIGKIIHFQIEMPQETYLRVDSVGNAFQVQNWRLHDLEVPIIYLDLAVHMHQLMYYLIGQYPINAVAIQKNYNPNNKVIDNVMCLVEYPENVDGQYWWSKSALGERNGLKIRIFGTKASVEWKQEIPELLSISDADGRKQIIDRGVAYISSEFLPYERFKPGHPTGYIESFANLYKDIHSCLLEFKENKNWKSNEVFSSELALKEMSFFDAILRSLKSRSFEAV